MELRSRIVPRVLAAVLAASTLAVLFALFQSDVRGLLAASAGSWVGIAPEQAMASTSLPAVRQIPLKDPARMTDKKLASADTQGPPAPSTPSREAIATAYQTALQAQAPAPAPVAAPPAPPPPAKTLDADTLAGLMTRAKSLLRIGDIAAARLLLERAADAQDATAALLLAQTYDPAVLGTATRAASMPTPLRRATGTEGRSARIGRGATAPRSTLRTRTLQGTSCVTLWNGACRHHDDLCLRGPRRADRI